MPIMTPELQAAYNEWLLKFGFREVLGAEMRADKTMLDTSEITNYKDWQRCIEYDFIQRSYQLRTLAEIEIYDEKQNNS